jgi:hypothetical protein
MNERIQEFILQATVTTDVYNPDTGITHYREFFDHEKFAELIVAECTTVIEQNLFQGIGWNTSRAVRRHFGIEDEE